MLSRAHKVFSEAGDLTDEAVRGQLRDFLHGFVQFIQAGAAPQ